MSTAQIISAALDAFEVKHSQDGDREFLSVSDITNTEQSSLDFLNRARAYLRSCGWQVTAFSNGFGHRDGARYFTAGVDAMRGTGPLTAHERHMISTCTGRD